MSEQKHLDFSRGRLQGLIDRAQFDGRRGAAVKSLLRALVWFGQQSRNGACSPKLGIVAWRMNVSRSTAQRAVRQAEEWGVLRVKRVSFYGGQQASQYQIDEAGLAGYVPEPVGHDARALGQNDRALSQHDLAPRHDDRAIKEDTSDPTSKKKPQEGTSASTVVNQVGDLQLLAGVDIPQAMNDDTTRSAIARFLDYQQQLGKFPAKREVERLLLLFVEKCPDGPGIEFARVVELMILKGWEWCQPHWGKQNASHRSVAAPSAGVVYNPGVKPGPL